MNGPGPAGERLGAVPGTPRRSSWGFLTGLQRLRRDADTRPRDASGLPTGVHIVDRARQRIVHEIDCGGDPVLAERILEMVETDLRVKSLDEFVRDYGIDPRRVAS